MHTHTHICTHVHTHTHIHICTRVWRQKRCCCCYIYLRTHTQIHIHSHTHAHKRQHMCAHIHGQERYCHIPHTHKHAHTHILMKSGDFVRGDRTRGSAAFGPSTNQLATDAIKRLIIIWHLSRLLAELVHLRDYKCQKHYDLLITNCIIYPSRTPCDITNSEGMLSRLQAELVRLRDFEVVRRERDEQFQIRFENEVCVRTLKPIYSAIHCI